MNVKHTFWSIMSKGWPLYDLHIRNYQGSKGSTTPFLLITWDRNVRRGWELRHCDWLVVLLWHDPWPQFDLWWPLVLFVNFLCFFKLLTPFLNVKGTFRSIMSMGWPLYDLHIRNYQGSKGSTTILSITWDRNVTPGWELRHCDWLVVLLWHDPWPQFDLWWPLVLFVNFLCFFKLLTPFLNVKGTFRSIMSMGWPLYDLHIRNYQGSKGSTTILSIM